MDNALNTISAITVFVDDLARSKSWYVHVFDRPVAFEDAESAVIKFDNTIINLLVRAAAPELIAPAVVAHRESGSAFQFTLWVDNADAACITLAERGVVLINGPMNRAWGQRTACFADPDGHIWEIAQTLS